MRLIENHEAIKFGGHIEMGAGIALFFVNKKADELEGEFRHVRIHQFTRAHAPNLGQRSGEHAPQRFSSRQRFPSRGHVPLRFFQIRS